MRSCLLIPLLLTAALGSAADVELSLTNGRTVRGELVSETDSVVTLRSRFPARGAAKQVESVYAKGEIMRRKELASAAQQYEERKARTPDTVPEQCTLAQWAYESCLREQARFHALRVLELDGDNAWGRRILDNCGYIEVAGAWVDEAEHLKANNLVRVDGEILAAGLAEARRAYTRAHVTCAAAKRKLDETREVASGKAGSAATAEGKAKEATAQAEAAKKSIDEAEKALAAIREESAGKNVEERKARQAAVDAATKRLTDARDQHREAKRTAEKAKQTGISDKASAERAKASIADLEVTLAKAEAELKAAAAKLPADDPLLTKPAAEEKKPETKADAPAGEKPAEPQKPQVRRLRSGGGD